MDLPGGVMNFSTVDAFRMFLETGFTLVLVNVKGLGGAGALREPIDSNRSFPVMSAFSTVLDAFETLQHMLEFRSGVSCFGLRVANLWLCDLDTTFVTDIVSCSAAKLNVSFEVLGCGRTFWLLTTCLFFVFRTPFFLIFISYFS